MIWSRSEWCERRRAMGAAWSGVALFICCLLPLLCCCCLATAPHHGKAWAGRTSWQFNKTQSPPLDCLLPAKIE